MESQSEVGSVVGAGKFESRKPDPNTQGMSYLLYRRGAAVWK